MKGIIKKGSEFKGALDYDRKKKLRRDLVEIIDKKDVVVPVNEDGEYKLDVNLAAKCFERQASLRRSVEKPVCHLSLSFDPHDIPKLTIEFLKQIASEYMQKMGYVNTQYVIAQHKNTSNPHLHLTINMVDNDGGLISIKHEKMKNTEVCRELTDKYHLTIGHWKGINKCEIPINSEERRMTDIHYKMAEEVTKALSHISKIEDLPATLRNSDSHVQAHFEESNGETKLYLSKTYVVNEEVKLEMLESKYVDKRLSISNINSALELKATYPQIIAEINEACKIIPVKKAPETIKQMIADVQKTINDEPWACDQSKDVGYMPLYLELARRSQDIIMIIAYADKYKKNREERQRNNDKILNNNKLHR